MNACAQSRLVHVKTRREILAADEPVFVLRLAALPVLRELFGQPQDEVVSDALQFWSAREHNSLPLPIDCEHKLAVSGRPIVQARPHRRRGFVFDRIHINRL